MLYYICVCALCKSLDSPLMRSIPWLPLHSRTPPQRESPCTSNISCVIWCTTHVSPFKVWTAHAKQQMIKSFTSMFFFSARCAGQCFFPPKFVWVGDFGARMERKISPWPWRICYLQWCPQWSTARGSHGSFGSGIGSFGGENAQCSPASHSSDSLTFFHVL